MTTSYQRFSGFCGFLAGLFGLLYLVFFIIYKDPANLLPTLALLAVGLLAVPLLVGLYLYLRSRSEGFALLGLLFGIGGAGGAAVQAAFDLANNVHAPSTAFGYANPVDPRGFLTFAVAGLAILIFSGLITNGRRLPRNLGYLGWVGGGLLIALFVAYLLILSATNPVVLFLVFASGIIQPVWYLWVGWRFWRSRN